MFYFFYHIKMLKFIEDNQNLKFDTSALSKKFLSYLEMETSIPNSFSQINYDLLFSVYEEVDSMLLNQLLSLITKSNIKDFNVVITGNIGVGKSTAAEIFRQLLDQNLNNQVKVVSYPEYIRIPDVGENMLKLRNSNRITVETFQHFILDCWDRLLTAKEFNNENQTTKRINIFERLPEDSINCFARQSFMNNEISEEGFTRLNNRYNELIKQQNMFEAKDCIIIKTHNEKTIGNLINRIIKNMIDCILQAKDKTDFILRTKDKIDMMFILTVKEETYCKRIKIRGRDAESTLSKETLLMFNDYYESFVSN